jgi:hypothetical protein
MRSPSVPVVAATGVFVWFLMSVPVSCFAAPKAANVTPISSINTGLLMQEVAVRGTVTVYKPPTSEKAPHSFMLKDDTGAMRVVIWQRDWDKIDFRNDLMQPGATVTAKLRVADFKGSVELHLEAAERIRKGSVNPEEIVGAGGARTPSAAPPPKSLNWQTDLSTALAEAKRDKKKILVFFNAPDAEPSKYAESHVFSDPAVISEVSGLYVPLMVNLTTQRELATRLGVFRGGVVGLYNPDGSAIKQITTVRSRTDFLTEIR